MTRTVKFGGEVLLCGKSTSSAGKHDEASKAARRARQSGDGEAVQDCGNSLDRLHEMQLVRVSRAGESESKRMKSQGILLPLNFRDKHFMRLAIAEAKLGIGKTAPNPAVGAVLVKNGRLLAKGHHHAAGMPHAEIEALSQVTATQSHGATIYITLEPCSSHGRTPPCTEAIIAAGIKRVIYGATDPDSRHQGRATQILCKAGIEVVEGFLSEECTAVNTHWNHRISTGLPWVITKVGMSLDGRLDSPPNRRWITSAASRKEAMKLRASVEAILVGGGTVRADDPALTIRGIKLDKDHPQPWRVIWSRTGDFPKEAQIFTDKHRERTLLFTGKNLRSVLKELGKRGINSVLIEGGGTTLGEAFDKNLVDEIRFFIAPIIQGGQVPAVAGRGRSPKNALKLTDVLYKKIGSDVMISAKVKKH